MGRRWAPQLIAVAFMAGFLLYGAFCYRVVMAGGMSATSVRPTCSKAATGSESRAYRSGESVVIKRSYLPPTAICQWSGGTTVALVPADVISWAGPVLVAGSVLTALSITVADGVQQRRRRKRQPSTRPT